MFLKLRTALKRPSSGGQCVVGRPNDIQHGWTRRSTGAKVFCKNAPAQQPNSGSAEPARRINDTSRVSLKSQLRMVKVLKKLSSDRQEVKTRTAHRKKKVTGEEREVYKAQQRLAEEEARKTGKVTFKSLYGTDGMRNPPVLLVDGYNIIGRLRQQVGMSGFVDSNVMDEFRSELLHNITEFSHYRGIKTIVVYDALNGPNKNTTKRESSRGVDVVWAGESEADTFISMHVTELYEQGCPQVFVATNDSDLQITSDTNQAYIISGRRLINEIKEATKECRWELQQANHRSKGLQVLSSTLPSDTAAALEALRQGNKGPKEIADSKLHSFQSKLKSKYS